jgi:hypothetical protein
MPRLNLGGHAVVVEHEPLLDEWSPAGGVDRRKTGSKRVTVMIRMFVKHKVHDYAAWRKGYDAFEPSRNKLGARGHAVYRDVGDANDVTAWHAFDNLDAAQAFAASAELKAAMKGAGVVGVPMIWFTRLV